ncbi:hypothetical protein NQ317_009621 [Molorchus minor]|uniref:Uncharacterized protein n=1 Tax=Molorchus minor TaxID=1323400 RepID=A0ABQ9JK52_9CUCU|nr:hypothetical protein NQ317_009621 [Molorchus minor]
MSKSRKVEKSDPVKKQNKELKKEGIELKKDKAEDKKEKVKEKNVSKKDKNIGKTLGKANKYNKAKKPTKKERRKNSRRESNVSSPPPSWPPSSPDSQFNCLIKDNPKKRQTKDMNNSENEILPKGKNKKNDKFSSLFDRDIIQDKIKSDYTPPLSPKPKDKHNKLEKQ